MSNDDVFTYWLETETSHFTFIGYFVEEFTIVYIDQTTFFTSNKHEFTICFRHKPCSHRLIKTVLEEILAVEADRFECVLHRNH